MGINFARAPVRVTGVTFNQISLELVISTEPYNVSGPVTEASRLEVVFAIPGGSPCEATRGLTRKYSNGTMSPVRRT
jgi:hypothetical protein